MVIFQQVWDNLSTTIGYSELVPTTKILGRKSWKVAGNPNLKAHLSVVFSYEYIVITD